MVKIVSMATEKILITHSSELEQRQYLEQMFLGSIAVAKGIIVSSINFVRFGTRELSSFFFVAMVKISAITLATERS